MPATGSHGMMVSLLPTKYQDGGLNVGQFIRINATVLDWQDHLLLTTAPVQPDAATDPIAATRATWLKASSVLFSTVGTLLLSIN